MRAAIYARYGDPDVIQITDVEQPVPAAGEILVRVHATTIVPADWRFRKAEPFFIRAINGVWRPKRVTILGQELAGVIERVGENATRFRVGDQVFGSTGFKFGAHAEYVCLPERNVLPKPDHMSFEEAAAIFFGALSALVFLRRANVKAGQNVLIYGASGSVGTFAIQLAKHFGAEVTAVCSRANLALVRSLGADKAVDYTKEDFSRAGPVYDIVFDAVGKSGYGRSVRALKRGGVYVRVAGSLLASMLRGPWTSLTSGRRVVAGLSTPAAEDVSLLKTLVEGGRLKTVIDRRYALQDIATAHRYVEAGHKRGNVIIIFDHAKATTPTHPVSR
jgi:NADPH:quinone reductase-like Zn-dependent oxidoreductase